MLKPIRTLGFGHFGHVYEVELACQSETLNLQYRKNYALKMISLDHQMQFNQIKQKQIDHLFSEKNVLQMLHKNKLFA
jgi:hypothetical protein